MIKKFLCIQKKFVKLIKNLWDQFSTHIAPGISIAALRGMIAFIPKLFRSKNNQ